MKKKLLTTAALTISMAVMVLAIGGRITPASRAAAPTSAKPAAAKPMIALTAGRSELPTEATAAFFLNRTPRHGELHRVPLGSLLLHSYIVYPDRAQRAPVLLIQASNQGLTDWLRAVADQAAQEGFLAVVPDVLSGANPHYSDSSASQQDMTKALEQMDPRERERRIDAVRNDALHLFAASGKSASLTFDWSADPAGRMQAVVASDGNAAPQAAFALTEQAWPAAIAFLNRYTGNRTDDLIVLPPMIMDMGHAAMPNMPSMSAMAGMSANTPKLAAQADAPAQAEYPMGKRDDLPAGLMTAKSTLAHTTIRTEWVFIPLQSGVKLRTRISYPQKPGKAPVVIMMHHAPGMDDWSESIADQLSREGFIAVLPDLLSGMGPNGGNYDSFPSPDEALKVGIKVTAEESMRRYKAAWEYAMKLPEASGKSASIGFCSGGGNSFRFAGEVPQEDAAVVFYGAPIPDESVMAKVKAPVIAFAGTDDIRVSEATQAADAKMRKLGKSYEFHIYQHATHGFMEYQQVGGNPEATKDAWPRAMAFLKKYTM
jgi:carboxymethylenebutenolidase